MSTYYDQYKVRLPERSVGRFRVEPFYISEEEARFFNLQSIFNRHGSRRLQPGSYTRMYEGQTLWMSDTPAEVRDHIGAIRQIERSHRVLINGLGIGLVLRAALLSPSAEEIDVVEISPEVIDLVGPHYGVMALHTGKTLRIHNDDAYTIKWPTGVRWDAAWHDVWPSINADNLKGMATLHRRYGRRVEWQGSWAREECEEAR